MGEIKPCKVKERVRVVMVAVVPTLIGAMIRVSVTANTTAHW